MKPQTRETMLGIFLLLVGAVVLVGPILIAEVDPTKWTIGAGCGLIVLGGWLVSPDPVTKRIKTVGGMVPGLHTHDEDSDD